MTDRFAPATTYLVVATKTRDRWFDLDAVREPHKEHTLKYPHGERHEENKGVRGYGVQNGEHAQHMAHGRATKNVETLGWTDCGHNTYRRGVVLDCFAGSGTTLAVAEGHGRDSIGIDIDQRNAELAYERVGGMFLTIEHLASEASA